MKMTLEEFRARVKVPHGVGAAAGVVAGILALLLIYNIRSAADSMDANPWASFWDLFWTTTGESGGTDPVLVALVWGPVVLLPVVLILWVADLVTHPARVARVHQEYLTAGWVGEQVPTGLRVTIGRAAHDLVVLAGPGLAPVQLSEPVRQMAMRVEAMDRKTRRAWDAQAAAGAQAGFAVGDLMPELPAGAIACTRRGKGDHVVVVEGAKGMQILVLTDAAMPARV
jgi:hypothetical protein